MTIIVIDSDHEVVGEACQEYRKSEVYPGLERVGLTIDAFEGNAARRARIAPHLKKPDVRFISGSGHGLERRFTGFNGESILEIGQYDPNEPRGKIIHLLACLTAAELGSDLVKNGCAAFFGYDVVFMFPLDTPELFLECDAEIDFALARGRTAAAAYSAAYDAFTNRIQQLLAAGRPYLAAMLEYNRDHLCAPSVDAKWGDENAAV